MSKYSIDVDVLCVGHACYDLVFSVDKHPQSDEKVFANDLLGCGGGPAANAAIAVSRLGLTAAFAGYLGNDLYGEMHLDEFKGHHINTQLVVRGLSPTPLSSVIVKPDGKRALINYKGATKALSKDAIDFSLVKAKSILLDGHEPNISLSLIKHAKHTNIPTILDAGSLHEGTSKLLSKVDYLVCSEKFACQYAGDVQTALLKLAKQAPMVVITLGEKGIIWRRDKEEGALAAFSSEVVDTTGAGDAFHGAFTAAVALGMDWPDILSYASAAGTLCCSRLGARQGLPWRDEHSKFLNGIN